MEMEGRASTATNISAVKTQEASQLVVHSIAMTPRHQDKILDELSSTITKNRVGEPATGSLLLPALPDQPTIWGTLRKGFVLYILVPIVAPPFLAIAFLRKKILLDDLGTLHRLVSDATDNPVNSLPSYQDEKLLNRVYQLPSARRYLDRGALEWQKREGYCAPSTLRCVLSSYGNIPRDRLPEQAYGVGSTPGRWCVALAKWADTEQKQQQQEETRIPKMTTEVISGDVPFEEFLAGIRRVNDARCRVVVNYLRPALIGFTKPWWFPTHYVLGIFAGHFSPVIGVLEKDDLGCSSGSSGGKDDPWVAIFDVNHRYGGTYLVPATRLYRAVQAHDVATRRSRAVIVVTQDDL